MNSTSAEQISWAEAFGPSGAIFRCDGRYRLLLWRTFGLRHGPPLGVIMKNPSRAGVHEDDNTIRVLLRLAYEVDAGGILVGNLVPHVATNPREMVRALRERNKNASSRDEWIAMRDANCWELQRLRLHCQRVLVAWGRLEHEMLRKLASTALLNLSQPHWKGEVLVIGRNRDGSPHHPLRTKTRGIQLQPWGTRPHELEPTNQEVINGLPSRRARPRPRR